ncbi:MAG: sulfotransferase [Proteobacteria bacterium]|nr:sulfotransferase [Pseudomonadota bacterium]
MQLPTEFIQLPLRFDAVRLAAEIGAVGEVAWRPHPQGFAGNDAMPLIAANGNPDDDATAGPMAPTPALRACPYLRQVLAGLGSTIGRTRLMRIVGDGEVRAHADISYYWWERVRVHVPVITSAQARFQCGARAVNMAAGECWIFDTWREHRVSNPQPEARIHLVIDTPGSAYFWALAAAGRDPFAAQPMPFNSRAISFDAGIEPALRYERVNRPRIMSPWELATIAAWLEADIEREAIGSEDMRVGIRAALAALTQDWRSLWSAFGASGEGIGEYRALLDRLLEQFDAAAAGLHFSNNVALTTAVRSLIDEAALGKDAQVLAAPEQHPPMPGARRRMRRAVFIVCPPRSGSTLLFETLAQAPGLATIGDESHRLIEGIDGLSPAARQWSSNRLLAADADRTTARALAAAFAARARYRDGAAPDPARPFRLLEKTPKNALRVPFLAEVFGNATFVYLYRDPRETLSSMLDAWRCGRFRTYPALPDWPGPPWSLLLTPGWRDLRDLDLAQIVARQWMTTVETLIGDLQRLPPERWCVASYSQLVANPEAEIRRLCRFLGLKWDRVLGDRLPLSRYTLGAPDPEKWKRNATELERMLPIVEPVAARARDLFALAPDHAGEARSARHS